MTAQTAVPRCGCKDVKTRTIIRYGSYFRKSDLSRVKRFLCVVCRKTFSDSTSDPCFSQKKRMLNQQVYELLCSGVSQRRCARILKIHRTTVAKKVRFLAEQCNLKHGERLRKYETSLLEEIYFDEMETFEHTKLKPLSIALFVTPEREVLITEIAQMPAKGILASKSVKKYGKRPDERSQALGRAMQKLQSFVSSRAVFKSDKNPNYPTVLLKSFPRATHITTKGGEKFYCWSRRIKKASLGSVISA